MWVERGLSFLRDKQQHRAPFVSVCGSACGTQGRGLQIGSSCGRPPNLPPYQPPTRGASAATTPHSFFLISCDRPYSLWPRLRLWGNHVQNHVAINLWRPWYEIDVHSGSKKYIFWNSGLPLKIKLQEEQGGKISWSFSERAPKKQSCTTRVSCFVEF